MTSPRLLQIRALRDAGDADGYLAAARDLAATASSDLHAQIEAAYACDRHGDERDAIRYYDAAFALGVPDDLAARFLVGYGSTLRNVGRTEEAIARLGEAIEAYPDYLPLRAFLALALHSAGHHRAALATMLGALLDGAPDSLDGYQRALAHYYRELLET